MPSNPLQRLLPPLLWLCAVTASPQQPTPPAAAGTSIQATTSPELQPLRTRTADGTISCSAGFKLTAIPSGVYRVGGQILPPVIAKAVKPTFSDEARKFVKQNHFKKFEAISVVELTVDTTGIPQDLCVKKEAGYGLDRRAFEGVMHYRFIPGSVNGKAVPVRVAVEVKFATY
jgi:hypothetical protein